MHTALSIGDLTLLEAEGDVLAYERVHERERIVVLLNLGGEEQLAPVPSGTCRLLFSTTRHPYAPTSEVMDPRLRGDDEPFALAPNEGLILLMEPTR